MTRAFWMALLSVAGCTANVTPIEVADGCPEEPLRGPARFADEPEQQLIDDFEHETSSLPRIGGRDGSWILGTDSTSAHMQAGVSTRCAGRGQRAGHFSGNGFTSWGANWTAILRTQPTGTAVPYDATPYAGISFWAAASGKASAPFELPVGVTTMDVAWNGGICGKCMDYYRTTVSIGPSWRRYDIRFSDLAQSGEGDPQIALRLDKLVGFIVWPTRDFDVWLDDVRFEQ